MDGVAMGKSAERNRLWCAAVPYRPRCSVQPICSSQPVVYGLSLAGLLLAATATEPVAYDLAAYLIDSFISLTRLGWPSY